MVRADGRCKLAHGPPVNSILSRVSIPDLDENPFARPHPLRPLLRRHPGLSLTFAYVIASLVGLWNDAWIDGLVVLACAGRFVNRYSDWRVERILSGHGDRIVVTVDDAAMAP